MSLIEHLQQIPEFRAARGQRHELWLVLLGYALIWCMENKEKKGVSC
ncbi:MULTISPECIES: hypothetical protein [Leptolyngbya]|nr:hypothetical protein [Leptolyngbya sp. FACHB-1624]MBD1854000.1 hypothetical protein [Leptolyngbya sp. FACHB-1624]